MKSFLPLSKSLILVSLAGGVFVMSGCLQTKVIEKTAVPGAPQAPATTATPGGGANTGSGTTTTPGQSQANGPVVDGGGNVTADGQVFDLVEDKGLVEFDVKKDPIYGREIEPRFLQMNRELLVMNRISPVENFVGTPKNICEFVLEVPREDRENCEKIVYFGIRFGDSLRMNIGKRKWYFEEREIISSGCQNRSMISLDRQVAACQDDYEVRISKKVWDKLDETNKAMLIIHELLLIDSRATAGYKENKEVFERSVRLVNRLLATKNWLDARAELRSRSTHFASLSGPSMIGSGGVFIANSQGAAAVANLQAKALELCSLKPQEIVEPLKQDWEKQLASVGLKTPADHATVAEWVKYEKDQARILGFYRDFDVFLSERGNASGVGGGYNPGTTSRFALRDNCAL